MMILIKRFRKRIAILFLAVFLIPLIPSVPVSADPLPVQVPDFPYGQDSYYNVNNGGFALWQVHGSNYVSYVQTFSPGAVGKPDPIIIFNKTFFYDNYTYYLDVNYIIDTWDIYGNHLDGWPGSNTSNIRVPRPYQESVDDSVYATLVYCSDDVRWRNGSDTGIYMFMNYLVPGYADPTPTPTPEPSGPIPDSDLIDGSNLLFLFRIIDENNIYYNQYIGMEISNMLPWLMGGGKIYLPYFKNTDGGVTCVIDNGITFFKISGNTPQYYFDRYGENLPTSSSLNDFIDRVSLPLLKNASYGFSSWLQAYGLNNGSASLAGVVSSQSLLEIVAFNHTYEDNLIINYNSDLTPTATPTPTAVPTAIPQPTQNPDPTPTTAPDVKVVEPGDHWWDGIVKPIQYIFVPSQEKMMKLYNTAADKFGVQEPTKYEYDPNALIRPANVVLHFHPISLNGEVSQDVDVTLIDFKMVDDWLDSDPGKAVVLIIKAVFMLTMWGYMIYIFRKHIATINYTDAKTLEDPDMWDKLKGGD